MNAYLQFDAETWWRLAGWTMIHYVWIGVLIAAVALVIRLLSHRAAPNLRYVAALFSLVLLAAAPLAIAAWLIQNSPPLPGGAGGGFVGVAGQHSNADASGQIIIERSLPTASSDNARLPPQIITSPDRAARLPDIAEPSWLGPPASRPFSRANLEPYVAYLPWLWIVGTPATLALLALGIVGTQRLKRDSTPIDAGPITALCTTLTSSLRITRRITVAVCDRVAAPVLIGIVRPIILLPPAAITGWTPDEIEMVLLHELAHVRRWDNLVNLLQRLIESLLFFHPAVWLISTWVRREREACCDAIVVAHTRRPHAYAELLVNLAAQLQPSPSGRGHDHFEPSPSGRGQGEGASPTRRSLLPHPASSAMAAGPLRSRIRRILQLEDDPMLISGKSFLLTLAVFVISATLAVLYVPAIGQAEESTAEVAEESTAENTEGAEKNEPPREESTGADQNKSPDAGRIARFEKALQDKISGGKFPSLEEQKLADLAWKRYEKLSREGKTIWLYGMDIDPASDAAKRYNIGPSPTLVVFRDGKETARLENIENAEQLDQFVAANLDSSRKPSRKFPSLEEQKLADLAWKRLGLELEPIGDEDLAKAKAFGYDGGVKVSHTNSPNNQRRTFNDVWLGDILVGLHVWPTTTLKDVAAVLERDDLAELNPLKFYVVRPGQPQAGAMRTGPDKDTLVTGRIAIATPLAPSLSKNRPQESAAPPLHLERVSLSELAKAVEAASAQGMEVEVVKEGDEFTIVTSRPRAATAPVVPEATRRADDAQQRVAEVGKHLAATAVSEAKVALRYEGAPFDTWQQRWRHDGWPNKLEALQALEAFAAAGYRKEATGTILMRLYDPNVAQYVRKYLSTLPEDEAHSVAASLLDQLAAELSASRRTATIRALAAIGPPAAAAVDALKKSLETSDRQERIAAAAALKRILGKEQYQKPLADVLGKELGITVAKTDSGDWAALPRDDASDPEAFNNFNDAVLEEQERLFPPSKPN